MEYKIIEKNYVAGKWVGADQQLEVTNPANGELVGVVPNLSDAELQEAIDNCTDQFKSWAATSRMERYTILTRWHQLIQDNKVEIAELMTLEQGKPLAQSYGEVVYGAKFIEWTACQLRTMTGEMPIADGSGQHRMVLQEPIGPVAAITPWNFPFAMVTRKLAPALAVGCTVILKPSEETPFSALYQAKLLEEAGLPAGVLNVVTCEPERFGELVEKDFRIRKISFTGSTRVGQLLYSKAVPTFKSVAMELGGNAPFVIFPDVDLDKVTDELITIKTRSSGQSCTSPNRILIHDDIYIECTNMLAEKFAKIKVGDGFAEDSVVGPLINRSAVEKAEELLKSAVDDGARIMTGGGGRDNFLECTVITDCTPEMKIFQTEIFGPVLACYRFSKEDELIEMANSTEYGLMSYCYSGDLKRADKIAGELDFGMVMINSCGPVDTETPFAGRKASGIGFEAGQHGIEEFMQFKYVNFNM